MWEIGAGKAGYRNIRTHLSKNNPLYKRTHSHSKLRSRLASAAIAIAGLSQGDKTDLQKLKREKRTQRRKMPSPKAHLT